MSYDVLMFLPKLTIRQPDEISGDSVLNQDPAAVAAALTRLLPSLDWERTDDGGWFARLDGDDGWYDFRLPAVPEPAWTIATSHRAVTRQLIPAICAALGLVAFDGQAMTVTGP